MNPTPIVSMIGQVRLQIPWNVIDKLVNKLFKWTFLVIERFVCVKFPNGEANLVMTSNFLTGYWLSEHLLSLLEPWAFLISCICWGAIYCVNIWYSYISAVVTKMWLMLFFRITSVLQNWRSSFLTYARRKIKLDTWDHFWEIKHRMWVSWFPNVW